MREDLIELIDWVEQGLAGPQPVGEVLQRAPDLSPLEAYRIQQGLIQRRVDRGDRIIGYKAALTSRAMQEQEGVAEPVLGTLLASRSFSEDEPISLSRFIRAFLEPEVGVMLKADLRGPGINRLDALAAVGGYLPCVEIGDVRSGENRPSLPGLIACNAFNGGHVFGRQLTPPQSIDLRVEGVVLWVDGQARGSATAVEVLGDPLNSVVFLANKLAEVGLSLQAGMVLLTGSIVKSVALRPGHQVQVDFTRLGRVRARFSE